MARCKNCGKVITTSNINVWQLATGLCTDCQDQSPLDLAITLWSLEDKKEYGCTHTPSPRKEEPRIVINYEPEELPYFDEDYEDEPPKPRKTPAEQTEQRIEYLRMGSELTMKAERNDVDAHVFSTDGICMFCGQHVVDCYENNKIMCVTE